MLVFSNFGMFFAFLEVNLYFLGGVMTKKFFTAIMMALSIASFGIEKSYAQTMKLGNAFVSDSHITNHVHELCDLINERTGGKYTLESYDDSKLGSAALQVKLLNAGNLNFFLVSSGNLSSFLPKIDVLDLPGITRFSPNMASVMNGQTSFEIYKEASNKNIVIISAFASSPRVFMFTKPVKTLEDAEGLKMRITQSKIHLAIMEHLGMTPVSLAWPECFTALQQKVIEGIDPDMAQGKNSSITSVAPYWAKFDIQPMTAVMVANRKWWEKLPEQDRKIIQESIIEVGNKCINTMYDYDQNIMKELATEGYPVYVPSEEERSRWLEPLKDLYKEFPHVPAEWIEKLEAEYAALE